MVVLTENLIWNLALSGVIVVLSLVFYKLIARAMIKNAFRKKVSKRATILTRKALRWVFIAVTAALLVVLWGGSLQNFWISLTGIFGIIAIGFFAVWSILSNIVAGMVLLGSKNINIDDNIEIVNEGIKGRIVDINVMFTILKSGRDKVQVPNNILLQKAVRVKIKSKDEF